MTTSSPSRTWVAAGVLLIVSTLLPLVAQSTAAALPGVGVFDALLFAAAVGLLALGSPSVTARRPLGTAALVVLGVWVVGVEIMWVVGGAALSEVLGMTWSFVDSAVRLALALIAAVAVARAKVVPRPWHLAGIWALIAVAVPQIVGNILAVSVTTADAVAVIVPLWTILSLAAGLFLGVLAIVLGITRPRRETEDRSATIYSGRADDSV